MTGAGFEIPFEVDRLRAQLPVAVLDELDKYSKWKTLFLRQD